jgi:membrane protein
MNAAGGEDTMRDRVQRWSGWAAATLPGRCVRRFLRIEGTNRSLVLAGQAFTTLVPLLIIVASASGAASDSSLGDALVARFRLTGESADAMRTLFRRPPTAGGVLSLVGLVVLLSALFSLTGALQRIYEAAWELPRRGLQGRLIGLTGTSVLFAQLIVLTLLASAVRGIVAGPVFSGAVRFVIGIPVWLVLQYLLLSRRIPPRVLLPGAIVASAGQLAVSIYSALWMPRVVATNAERYGLIGVTFALVSWLIVVGLAVVAGAVVSAELGWAAHPSRAIPGPRAVPSLRASIATEGSGDGGPGGARLPEQGGGRAGDGGRREPT